MTRPYLAASSALMKRLSKTSSSAHADVPGNGVVLHEAAEEFGVVGGEHHVHGRGQHPAGVDAVAFDHGDGRLGKVAPGQQEIEIVALELVVALDARLGPQGFAVFGPLRGAEVVAGREDAAGPTHQHHPHGLVAVARGAEDPRSGQAHGPEAQARDLVVTHPHGSAITSIHGTPPQEDRFSVGGCPVGGPVGCGPVCAAVGGGVGAGDVQGCRRAGEASQTNWSGRPATLFRNNCKR